MASLRTTSCFKQLANRLRGSATPYSTASPNVNQYVSTPNIGSKAQAKKASPRGDFIPVYVAIGAIALSTTLGLGTALLELMHSPQVRVKKKMRETLPEVEEPDTVVNEADRFVKNSLFRKVAHLLDFHHADEPVVHMPGEDCYFHVKPKAESLKDVGVDPKFRVVNQ